MAIADLTPALMENPMKSFWIDTSNLCVYHASLKIDAELFDSQVVIIGMAVDCLSSKYHLQKQFKVLEFLVSVLHTG